MLILTLTSSAESGKAVMSLRNTAWARRRMRSLYLQLRLLSRWKVTVTVTARMMMRLRVSLRATMMLTLRERA